MSEKYEIGRKNGDPIGYANDRDLANRIRENMAKEQEQAEEKNRARNAEIQRELAREQQAENRRIYAERRARQQDEERMKKLDEEVRKITPKEEVHDDRLPGMDFSLRNPKNLSERRARANYWRLSASPWGKFVAKVSGKDKRFHDLWNEYSDSKEERRKEIVEEMEKMFPTTDKKLATAERKQR